MPSLRVTRYPVPFVFEGQSARCINPLSRVLVPLHLHVSDASEDTVLELRFGDSNHRLGGWKVGQGPESRPLSMLRPEEWRPGTLATLVVERGSVRGAALMCSFAAEPLEGS